MKKLWCVFVEPSILVLTLNRVCRLQAGDFAINDNLGNCRDSLPTAARFARSHICFMFS